MKVSILSKVPDGGKRIQYVFTIINPLHSCHTLHSDSDHKNREILGLVKTFEGVFKSQIFFRSSQF